VVSFVFGCGGASAVVEYDNDAVLDVGREPAKGSFAAEGIRGTVERADVEKIFQGRMDSLLKCYGDVLEEEIEEI